MTLNLTIPENINDAKPKISVIGIGELVEMPSIP